MAGKDEGQNGDSPEPVVSKGTAGEGIDDLGIPVGDDVTASDAEAKAEKGAAGRSAKNSTSTKRTEATKNSKSNEHAEATDDDARDGDAVAADDGVDEVPFELADDAPSAAELPETGLVSEFVDVNKRQASWLVSNRESSTVLRSPFFLVTGAAIVLGILAAIISGAVGGSDSESGTPSMAMVGVGEQAAMYEQQLGVKITDVEDAEAAEKLVREGKVEAAFIQDPTGQGQPTIIALDEQPEALLEKLAPKTEATLLNEPAVGDEVATPVLWGMAVFALLVVGTLGTALYQNLRLEKRNRITEIIAATIPPRASASGRITGMLSLTAVHLVVAIVVAELGLSITGKTSLAFAMLPGLGWFALTLLLTAWAIYGLLVWASTVTGSRARRTFVSIIGVITVGGFIAPVILGASGMVAKVLSWTPFTSPLGIAGRFFGSAPEWWEGLVAAAIALVLAFIIHSLASGAYVRAVLTGGGRGGKTVKMSKRAKKVSAGSASGQKSGAKDSTASDAKDSDAKDSDAKDSTASDENSDLDSNADSDDTSAKDEQADESTDVTIDDTDETDKKK